MRSAVLMLCVMLVVSVLGGCTRTAETGSPAGEQDSTAAQQVSVTEGEWYVRLDPSTVRPGRITFNIRNEGKALHAFELENGNVEERSADIQPGESTTMTVTLPAGEYTAYCPIGNHEGRGMHTMLRVEE